MDHKSKNVAKLSKIVNYRPMVGNIDPVVTLDVIYDSPLWLDNFLWLDHFKWQDNW